MEEKTKNDILRHAQVLWDYHNLDLGLDEADFILAMGSHDERVAVYAAQLMLMGKSPILVTSGGFGKVTKDVWKVSEGERFAEIAIKMGVPKEKIIIDNQATNTGDNITNSRRLLKEKGIEVRSGIMVTKPYMRRRAFATAAKQWPEIKWQVSSPEIEFQKYPNDEVPLDRMINLMVGDLQRMKVYFEKGFQIFQEIPSEVWVSYDYLVKAGYDLFVIKD